MSVNKFYEQIKPFFPWDEQIGLRLFLVAYFFIFIGVVFFLLKWLFLQYIFLVLGFLIAFVAMGIHYYMMWQENVVRPRQFEENEKAERAKRDFDYAKKREWLKSIGKL